MSVESTTTIAGLNALWPQGTDVKAEGDDHIRLIKSVLKAEFPTGSAGTVVATAQSRNRIVNGAMQISQENARGTNLTAAGSYFADQWYASFSSDGTISGFTSNVGTTLGTDAGPYFGTLVIGTADAAMAAGQYLQLVQPIEGARVSDFNWGTASALPVVLRFKATSTVAHTFAVYLKNGANNRSYVKNCTITANTPTWFNIVIPGDTTGTWPIDTSKAIELGIGLAAGVTFHASSEGAWVSGGCIATAATGNFWANAGARFSFGAVGLYLDPLASGVAPPWQMPDEAQELATCQRHWWKLFTFPVNTSATSSIVFHPVSMRVNPAFTTGGAPGFAAPQCNTEYAQIYQTTAGYQTLTISARM